VLNNEDRERLGDGRRFILGIHRVRHPFRSLQTWETHTWKSALKELWSEAPKCKAQRPVMNLCANQTIFSKQSSGWEWRRRQAGKILRVYCLTDEKRLRHVEGFLHGTQIR